MSEFEFRVSGQDYYKTGTVRAETYKEAEELVEAETRFRENHYTVKLKRT